MSNMSENNGDMQSRVASFRDAQLAKTRREFIKMCGLMALIAFLHLLSGSGLLHTSILSFGEFMALIVAAAFPTAIMLRIYEDLQGMTHEKLKLNRDSYIYSLFLLWSDEQDRLTQ